jgi:hypothetical protein
MNDEINLYSGQNVVPNNESGLEKYRRELHFEYELSDSSMPFSLWICDKIKRRDDMLTMSANAYKELKERYESAILEGDLLRTKNEELQEGLIEYQNDYQDICELAGQLALPIERESLMEAVGRENYDRFKNHIGW